MVSMFFPQGQVGLMVLPMLFRKKFNMQCPVKIWVTLCDNVFLSMLLGTWPAMKLWVIPPLSVLLHRSNQNSLDFVLTVFFNWEIGKSCSCIVRLGFVTESLAKKSAISLQRILLWPLHQVKKTSVNKEKNSM